MKKIILMSSRFTLRAFLPFVLVLGWCQMSAGTLVDHKMTPPLGFKIKIEGTKDQGCWGPKLDCTVEVDITIFGMQGTHGKGLITTIKAGDLVNVDEQI